MRGVRAWVAAEAGLSAKRVPLSGDHGYKGSPGEPAMDLWLRP